MLLNILGKVPFIQCLTHFPWKAHRAALEKFAVVWILTSLPILFAVFSSKIPDGNTDVTMKLLMKLKESIDSSELFVYTATFLTPIIYLIFEKYKESSENKPSEKLSEIFSTLFKGYKLTVFISVLLMIFTAFGFGQIKADPDGYKDTFLGYYLNNYVLVIYIFSLYCWYLSLLDGAWTGDFVTANRKSEARATSSLSERLQNRIHSDE